MVECLQLDWLRPHRRLRHLRNSRRTSRLRFHLDRPARQSLDSVRSPPLNVPTSIIPPPLIQITDQ